MLSSASMFHWWILLTKSAILAPKTAREGCPGETTKSSGPEGWRPPWNGGGCKDARQGLAWHQDLHAAEMIIRVQKRRENDQPPAVRSSRGGSPWSAFCACSCPHPGHGALPTEKPQTRGHQTSNDRVTSKKRSRSAGKRTMPHCLRWCHSPATLPGHRFLLCMITLLAQASLHVMMVQPTDDSEVFRGRT